MKTLERTEARRLRREEGLALREIAARVGVAVSSVSRWTRDIDLTPHQIEALRSSNRLLKAQRAGAEANRQKAMALRLGAQETGRSLARGGDPLHLAGCMLFWAEGSKTRNTVEFTNSDPDMLALFLRFLRRCYAVADRDLRLVLNCHLAPGSTLEEIEQWWLTRLGLPRSCLRAHTVNRNSRASGLKRRTLPFGTARVSVHSTVIVQSIYGGIQEFAGFERPGWLG